MWTAVDRKRFRSEEPGLYVTLTLGTSHARFEEAPEAPEVSGSDWGSGEEDVCTEEEDFQLIDDLS